MYLSIFCCRKQLSPPRLFLSLCPFLPSFPPLLASSFPARKERPVCCRACVSLFVQWPSGAWSRFRTRFLLWRGTGSEGAELRGERAEAAGPSACRFLPVCTLPSAPLVSAEGRREVSPIRVPPPVSVATHSHNNRSSSKHNQGRVIIFAGGAPCPPVGVSSIAQLRAAGDVSQSCPWRRASCPGTTRRRPSPR